MPQVPISQVSDQVSLAPASSGGGVTPVGQFPDQAGDRGRALAATGGMLSTIGARMSEEHALATSRAALNQWATYSDKIDTEYRSRRGKDATLFEGNDPGPYRASHLYAERMAERMRYTEQSLTSEAARRIFRQSAERALVTYRGRLTAHEVREVQAYNQGETTAAMARHAKSYATSGDQGDFDSAIGLARDLAEDRGLGPEQTKAFVLETQTAMHEGYLAPMMAEDPKAADAYLKSIPRDGIDAISRQKLRAQINGQLKARNAKQATFELFDRGGYTKDQARQIGLVNLPPHQQQEMLRSAVAEAAKERGLPASEIAKLSKVGDLSSLMSDPLVRQKLAQHAASLDDDAVLANFNGQDPAHRAGTYQRGRENIRKAHERGEIDAEEREMQERHWDTLSRRRAQAVASEQNALLDEAQRIGTAARGQVGGAISAYDPSFRERYPTLFRRASELGVLAQVDKTMLSAAELRTDPATYREFQRWDSRGMLRGLTQEQVRVKFAPHLSRTDYREVLQRWAQWNQAATKGQLQNGPLEKVDTQLRTWARDRGLISGERPDGTFTPDGEEEGAKWRYLRQAIDQRILTEGGDWDAERVLKAANEIVGAKLLRKDSGNWFIWPQWMGGDEGGGTWSEESEVFLRGEVERLKAAGKTREAEKVMQDLWVEVDGERTRVEDFTRATGTQQDPIPRRTSYYIKDTLRLEALANAAAQGRVPVSLVQATGNTVRAAGGLNPAGPRDHKAIEDAFRKAGLPGWPSIPDQFRRWRGLRPRPVAPVAAPPPDPSAWAGGVAPDEMGMR